MNPLTPRCPAPVFPCALVAALALGTIATHTYVQNAPVTIAPPPRPPALVANGFPLLQAAGAKLTRLSDLKDVGAVKPEEAWTPTRKKALVAANAPALQAARAALKLPYRETNDKSFMANCAYYATFRGLCRVFVLSGDAAWDAGRPRDAANDYLHAVTIGRRVPYRTTLIPRLVGIACEMMGRRALWNRVESMDAATAAYTLSRLNALQAENLPYSATLEEERYGMQNTVIELYARRDDPAMVKEWGMESDAATALAVYTRIAPRPYVLRSVREHMDKLIAQSKKPYYRNNDEIRPSKREPMTYILMPVFTHARTKYVAQVAGGNLLRTALALHIYKKRTGAYPAQLSELVQAKLLPTVPADPFAAPETALTYRRLPDGTYHLYSIGADGTDDNGKPVADEYKNGSKVMLKDAKGDMVAGNHPY